MDKILWREDVNKHFLYVNETLRTRCLFTLRQKTRVRIINARLRCRALAFMRCYQSTCAAHAYRTFSAYAFGKQISTWISFLRACCFASFHFCARISLLPLWINFCLVWCVICQKQYVQKYHVINRRKAAKRRACVLRCKTILIWRWYNCSAIPIWKKKTYQMKGQKKNDKW